MPESSHPNCRCIRMADDDSIDNGKITTLLEGAVSSNRDEDDLGLPNSNKDDDFEVVADLYWLNLIKEDSRMQKLYYIVVGTLNPFVSMIVKDTSTETTI